jgi:hypothetical protein
MAPHIEACAAMIAEDLQVELDQVNVKATTTEKLALPVAKRASRCIPSPAAARMTELELLGPRAHGEPCGSAVLKAVAEDFQVDEVLDIPLWRRRAPLAVGREA